MSKVILILVNLFSFAAYANSDLEQCGSQADRKLKAVYQTVAFPAEYIQWGFVDRIERKEFINTTPGTMDQEYAATYRVIYKPAPYAYFTEQLIQVQFKSPFACEDLKLSCIQVIISKVVEKVDPSMLLKTGPLACGN